MRDYIVMVIIAFASCDAPRERSVDVDDSVEPHAITQNVIANQSKSDGSMPTFNRYDDAAIFLKGLIDVEYDNYGNLVIFRDGNWGQRCEFRLSDVDITSREIATTGEYYGGQIGPRVEISIKCRMGPCISDPVSKDMAPIQEKSFFVLDISKGRKVFTTLQSMQLLLSQ